LAGPGEKIPDTAQNGAGSMKPVEFPKQKPDDYPDATNLPRDHKPDADDAEQQSKPDAQGTQQKKDQNANPQPGAPPAAGSSQPAGQGNTPSQTHQSQPPEPLDTPQPH
jgi:hypothetical protein